MSDFLELDNVRVGNPDMPLLQPTTMELTLGPTVLFLGPSGSGKSTLLKVAAGLFPSDDGDIRFRGRSFQQMTTAEFEGFHRMAGFVFQNAALWQNMSLRQNLALALSWAYPDLPESVVRERVLEVAQRVGYTGSLDVRPADVSTGEQKALGFARALILDPEVYFLDAPLTLLDGARARKMMSVLRELKSAGKTLYMVTNNLDYAFQIADRVVLLDGGQVHFQGPLAEAVQNWPPFLDNLTQAHARTLAERGILVPEGTS